MSASAGVSLLEHSDCRLHPSGQIHSSIHPSDQIHPKVFSVIMPDSIGGSLEHPDRRFYGRVQLGAKGAHHLKGASRYQDHNIFGVNCRTQRFWTR